MIQGTSEENATQIMMTVAPLLAFTVLAPITPALTDVLVIPDSVGRIAPLTSMNVSHRLAYMDHVGIV